jgi:hypothetical protein
MSSLVSRRPFSLPKSYDSARPGGGADFNPADLSAADVQRLADQSRLPTEVLYEVINGVRRPDEFGPAALFLAGLAPQPVTSRYTTADVQRLANQSGLPADVIRGAMTGSYRPDPSDPAAGFLAGLAPH